jgi:hypothetical protein
LTNSGRGTTLLDSIFDDSSECWPREQHPPPLINNPVCSSIAQVRGHRQCKVLVHLRRISNPLTLGQIGLGWLNSKASIWRHATAGATTQIVASMPSSYSVHPAIAVPQKAAHMSECGRRNRHCSRHENKDFAGTSYSLTAISLCASPGFTCYILSLHWIACFSTNPISSTIWPPNMLSHVHLPAFSVTMFNSVHIYALFTHNKIRI